MDAETRQSYARETLAVDIAKTVVHNLGMKTALAILGFLVALALFELKLRIRKRRRIEAEHLAAVRAIHAPQEARAALTQWILQRTFEFTVGDALTATEAMGRPMEIREIVGVCETLSVNVPSLRGILPPDTLRPLPVGNSATVSTTRNGARVTRREAAPGVHGVIRGLGGKTTIFEPRREWERYTEPNDVRQMVGCDVETCGENARWRSGSVYRCHEHKPIGQVTGAPGRPPETMRMTRTEYLEWQRNQGKVS